MAESSSSPLAAIRDKERTLANEIRAAQANAAAKVAEAHARADALKEQAERDGLREADALYQDGLAKAREQAAKISTEGDAQAVQLLESGRSKIAKAADHIVQFVLPKTN